MQFFLFSSYCGSVNVFLEIKCFAFSFILWRIFDNLRESSLVWEIGKFAGWSSSCEFCSIFVLWELRLMKISLIHFHPSIFMQGDLHSTGGIQISFQGVYKLLSHWNLWRTAWDAISWSHQNQGIACTAEVEPHA